MTLILSAICKDGFCICADKKSTKPSGKSENNLYKIYSFKNIPLVIFNHGINNFDNKSWDEYCSEYESQNRWKGRNLYEICDDFKGFIENDVEKELKKNFSNGLINFTFAAFDFCGKTPYNVNLKIYELFWSYDSTGLKLQRPPLGRLVLSGDGKDYLQTYLNKNGDVNKDKYWKDLTMNQAKIKLEEMFNIAIEEQTRSGKSIFSDEYDVKCISVKF